MNKKTCKKCKKVIILDFKTWLEENKESQYLQCPYCFYLEKLKDET